MNFCTHIRILHRLDHDDFDDSVASPLAPPPGLFCSFERSVFINSEGTPVRFNRKILI